jgi:hypothetical protein
MTVINLVTPKVGAKHELLFNKPVTEAGLLSKSSCLAAALGVTKNNSHIYESGHTLLRYLIPT